MTDPRGKEHRTTGNAGGDLRPGGEFRADLTDAGERAGHVDVCEPPHRLTVTMRDPDARTGRPGQTVIDGREPRPAEPRWEMLLPRYEALAAGAGEICADPVTEPSRPPFGV